MKIFLTSALLLCLASFSACKKKQVELDMHEDYYPIEQGKFVEYEVFEMNHDILAVVQHDTNHYYLKTVIGDTIIDNEGRIARKFLRYTKDSLNGVWNIKDVWTTIVVDRRAELVEENQRMVKMVFRPTIDKTWDMNAYNSYNALECYYLNIHKSYQNQFFQFDSTVTVIQEDFSSMIDFRKKSEVYAKSVGLIAKRYKNLVISNFDSTNIKSGQEIYYNLLNYGKE